MNAFQKVNILDLNHFMVVTSRLEVVQIKMKLLNWLAFSKNWVRNIFYLIQENETLFLLLKSRSWDFDNVLPW